MSDRFRQGKSTMGKEPNSKIKFKKIYMGKKCQNVKKLEKIEKF